MISTHSTAQHSTAQHTTPHHTTPHHTTPHYTTPHHSTYLIIGEVKVEHGELRRGHGVDRMLHEGDGVEVAGKVHHETTVWKAWAV